MASSLVTVSKPFVSQRTSFPSFSTTPTGFKWNSLKVNAISTKYEPSKVVPQADRVLIRLEALAEIVSIGTEAEQVETGKKVLFFDIMLTRYMIENRSLYKVHLNQVELGTEDRHVFCKASELLAVVE